MLDFGKYAIKRDSNLFRDNVRLGGAIMPSGHGGASMNSVINNEYAYCGSTRLPSHNP